MVTDQIRHPIFARMWTAVSAGMDDAGLAEHRRALLRGLSGRVLEIGAGDGRNFAHYPPEVTAVLAVEPEPRLRAAAIDSARQAPVPVEVVPGVAERLPLGDADVDAAVACQVLCSVTDLPAALGELRRTVRPGGQLRFLEHVRADTPGLRRVQRVLDATIWPFLFGGCHPYRDTLAAIRATGFVVEEDSLRAFEFPPTGPRQPASPHVRGVASRPEG